MPPATLYELFEHFASADRPDLLLRREGSEWTPISSRDFSFSVRALSLGLNALEMQPGDRVAILSENRPEWAITDYAVVCAGALTVPIYATLPPDQVSHLLRDSGSKIVIVSTDEQLAKIRQIRSDCPALEHVVTLDAQPPAESGYEHWLRTIDRGRGPLELQSNLFETRGRRVRPEDPCTIIYTSGTTGDPKGAILTHSNFISNVLSATRVIPFESNALALAFLPLSHVFERMHDYAYASRRCSIAYLDDLNLLRDAMPKLEPHVFAAVPRVYEKIYAAVQASVAGSRVKGAIFGFAVAQGRKRLARRIAGEEHPTSLGIRIADALVYGKLRARLGHRFEFATSGGAPLARELIEFFWGAGLTIYEGYGLTETSPVVSVNGPGRWKLGSVGRPIPDVEVRIEADGEISTRGPHVMRGYWNKPAETAEVLDPDGWFHTGDIGQIDGDGFLFITGRKKEIIVLSGGKKAAPQPIENALKRSPLISLPIVIGDRRKFLAALIVPNFERWPELPREMEALNSDPAIRRRFQVDIDRYNLGRPHHEQIRAFALLPRELTIEAGEITPTLKVRRGAIEKEFRKVIDRMYEAAEREHGA